MDDGHETPRQNSDRGDMSIFRPPVLRSAVTAALDRALFSKTYNLAAARVTDVKNISKYRKALSNSKELLELERASSIVNDPAAPETKCLLLKPSVLASVPDTWSEVVKDGVKQEELGIVPYELTLDYDYWSTRDVLSSLLPEELVEEVQASFNIAGHVAHFNLRERFLPYKHLIAEVIVDKNPRIETVINKLDDVGTDSEYRTFNYEVLAGPDDMPVEVKEHGCVYRFDYSKVYWNSRLEKEHTRLVNLFRPGEVVCDVMAGIGPFAVPAGKKGVFVWANDLNPDSFLYLKDSIEINKVSEFVRPFNEDGMAFIKNAADAVYAASVGGECAVVKPKAASRSNPPEVRAEPRRIPIPPTISHFVMNLPASAISFLGCYRGIYGGREALFRPSTETKLPLVHVHCFAAKSDDDVPKLDICERISKELGLEMRLGGDLDNDKEVSVDYVRAVAPSKSMYCASFRLPPEVAYAAREEAA